MRLVHCFKCGKRYQAEFNKQNRIDRPCPECGSDVYGKRSKAEADAIIVTHLSLAPFIANKFARSKPASVINSVGGVDECIAEARVGLCNAARLFEEDRGWKFTTYASSSMWNRLEHWLTTRRLHHAPTASIHVFRYADGNEREITELAVEDVRLLALVENEQLLQAVEKLKPIERDVVRLRLQEYGVKEIGKMYGFSKTRAQQILYKAYAKIAQQMDDERTAKQWLKHSQKPKVQQRQRKLEAI